MFVMWLVGRVSNMLGRVVSFVWLLKLFVILAVGVAPPEIEINRGVTGTDEPGSHSMDCEVGTEEGIYHYLPFHLYFLEIAYYQLSKNIIGIILMYGQK